MRYKALIHTHVCVSVRFILHMNDSTSFYIADSSSVGLLCGRAIQKVLLDKRQGGVEW